jgi:hypothetical protein
VSDVHAQLPHDRPAPRFEVGAAVLVDQARGVGRVLSVRWGDVPAIGAIDDATEPGYLYTIQPLDGPSGRLWVDVADFDLTDASAALKAAVDMSAEIQRGIEEAAATIVGPFLPLLTELPELLGVLFDQLQERLMPFARAALTYELRDVEERMHRLERSKKRREEPAEFGGQNDVAQRLSVLRARAEEIRAALWPEP